MADGPRISSAACEAVDELARLIREALADGRLSPAEEEAIGLQMAAVQAWTAKVDAGVAAAVTLIRRGIGSRQARELAADCAAVVPDCPA